MQEQSGRQQMHRYGCHAYNDVLDVMSKELGTVAPLRGPGRMPRGMPKWCLRGTPRRPRQQSWLTPSMAEQCFTLPSPEVNSACAS
eukprot:6475318-Amphidinium_carterae.7